MSAKWIRWAIGRENPADVIEANTLEIVKLQEQHDNQTAMVRQLHANAVRLNQQGSAAAARDALRQKKDMEVTLGHTAGKISTLQMQTASLQGLESNVAMFETVKRGNAVNERMATTLNVVDVETTMETAKDHKDDYREVSELLSGSTFLPVEDEDELDAELAAMTAKAVPAEFDRPIPNARAPIPTRAQYAQTEKREADIAEHLDTLPPAPRSDTIARIREQAAKNKNTYVH